MKNKCIEETKTFTDKSNYIVNIDKTNFLFFCTKAFGIKVIFIILTIINLIVLILNIFHKKKISIIREEKKDNDAHNNTLSMSSTGIFLNRFKLEKYRPILKDLNKKRTFEKRLPLAKAIKCKPHFSNEELIAFLSFLTKNITYFETGSGCSSIIAKYYTKKSYAIEGCRQWYDQGVKNGLKDNLIFRDLKPDNPSWSYPGKKSNINDWKKYFQSYNKDYNADIILLDGRFKVATAMDIFDKINNDTIVFLHEYQDRPIYFIIEKYYQYIYHWGQLTAFVKKKGITSIPLKIQKKYWTKFK